MMNNGINKKTLHRLSRSFSNKHNFSSQFSKPDTNKFKQHLKNHNCYHENNFRSPNFNHCSQQQNERWYAERKTRSHYKKRML